ncbi:leucine-rich repeat protein [Flammeovirga sp. MY04]|uniref:leucine-rich repeat domain-containing protein n=1 Tax=Flammeovirga sp. MY04 TaxID=1191459 RepID=UPI0008060F16|nr:leucine-rich repeat domain-containing protein [Flammeovirga sp. MY04]ANQ52777.1 leucine-rich repeat protein [Flammeovirga sp. MY04]
MSLNTKLYFLLFLLSVNYLFAQEYPIYTLQDKDVEVKDGVIVSTLNEENFFRYESYHLVIPEILHGQKIVGLADVNKPGDGGSLSGLFKNCHNIVELTTPSTLKFVGRSALGGQPIEILHLNEGLEEIRGYAFFTSRIMDNSFTLPNSIKNIEESAFGEINLQRLIVPKEVTRLINNALGRNDLSIKLLAKDGIWQDDDEKIYPSNEWIDYKYKRNFFLMKESPYTIKDEDVKVVIGAIVAVNKNINAKEIIIPNKLRGQKVISLQGYGLFKQRNIKKITLPKHLKTIGDHCFAWNKIENIVFPKQIYEIGAYAFFNNKITELELPSEVITMGEYCFSFNEIERINMPDNILKLSNNLFTVNKLKEVTIPKGVEIIGNSVFSDNDLTKINFNTNLKEIGDRAFFRNFIKEDIKIPSSVTKIGESAFKWNYEMNIILPKKKICSG